MRNSVIFSSLILLVCCTSLCSSIKRPETKSAKSILEEEDYYKILGVDRNANDKEIGRAFRKLAIQYHPDKSKDPNALKIFQKIGAAYDVLSDPKKRQQYDLGGSGAFNFQQAGGSFDFSNFNFDNLFGDFDDDLDDAFGSLFGNKKFKLFDDIPNIFESVNSHFGRGDSYFKDFSGEHQMHSRSSSFQNQQQAGRNCRTVTKKIGNTISTYTTCT